MRRRLGSWVVIAVVAAGCATPDANHQPTVNDQTDVWFAQHMVPHLLQDTSIASLIGVRLTDPELVRLAGRIHRRSQAPAAQLLEWLAEARDARAHLMTGSGTVMGNRAPGPIVD